MKILWGVTIVCGVILVGVWMVSLKSELAKISYDATAAQDTPESATKHITIERAEFKNGTVNVYFMVNNDTNDILNFSKKEDIRLSVNGQSMSPENITDRIDKPFVQKILSKTQKGGILVFKLEKTKSATLIFDKMFFENNAETIFKETFELDFEKL